MEHNGKINFKIDGSLWCATAIFDEKENEEILMGGIHSLIVTENEEIKTAFMNLMVKAFKHMILSGDPEAKVVFLDKTEEPNVNQ